MPGPIIEKPPMQTSVTPNLVDYASARDAFSWDTAAGMLTGLPDGGGLNIAYEAVDRHAIGAAANRVALRCLRKTDRRRRSATPNCVISATVSPMFCGGWGSVGKSGSAHWQAAFPSFTSLPSEH